MNSRKNRNLKKKRGGGLFSNSKVVSSTECDINNLSTISKDMGDGQDPLIKMRTNYQKCCPKDFMGRKNSSPYCKQLNMNFNAQSNYQRDIAGYYGDETDVSKIKQIMNDPMVYSSSSTYDPMDYSTPSQKPWYKFWAGKRTKRHRKRSHKRHTYKRK
jgi:hypothetical protein